MQAPQGGDGPPMSPQPPAACGSAPPQAISLDNSASIPGELIRPAGVSPSDDTVHVAGDHVPLQSYTITPSRVATRVCARTGSTPTGGVHECF
ncbi:hypothetical protein ACWCQQ_41635 [Streptomyces sp. NPDC002143]